MAEGEQETVDSITIAGAPHVHLPLEVLMSDRIHYGCGTNVKDGWLNVDGFDGSLPYERISEDKRERIVFIDLAQRHPFESETFSYAYSEHMVEHLDQAESLNFLSEAYRTLKPCGVLRLCFPGLAGVLKRHYRSSDFEGAQEGRDEAFTPWFHKHFYCFESLKLVGEHIGFSRIYEVAHGKSEFEALCGAETREAKEDGIRMPLGSETP